MADKDALERRLQDLLAAARARPQSAPRAADAWRIAQKLGDDPGNLLNAVLATALKRKAKAVLFELLDLPNVDEGHSLLVQHYEREAAIVARLPPATFPKVLTRVRSLAGIKARQTDSDGAFLAAAKQVRLRIDVHTFRGEVQGAEDCVLLLNPASSK